MNHYYLLTSEKVVNHESFDDYFLAQLYGVLNTYVSSYTPINSSEFLFFQPGKLERNITLVVFKLQSYLGLPVKK